MQIAESAGYPRFTFRAVTYGISRKTAFLQVVALRRITPARVALLDVLHLGAGVLLGAVQRDEACGQFPQ